MPGICPEVAQHRLNIELGARSIKQRPRKFTLVKQRAIEDEVGRLLEVGLI
ncbi:hypothetical protein BHM03_00034700, partial [Ensete ventricosum]